MKLQEAFKILGVSPSISDDDLKKKWRSLAKEFHPDVNKDHPDKLKQINEAYQFIKNHKENPVVENPFDINDIMSNFQGFSGFRQQQGPPPRRVEHIHIEQEISFEESVLGVEREIEVDRELKCETCNGQGFKLKKNDCRQCDGFGHSSRRQGNVVYNTLCSQCKGQSTKEECLKCNKKTYINTKSKMKVKIPAGVCDTNIIQLQGAGHYANHSIFGDAHSNILINIKVKNDTKLKLDGNDVIYSLDISLLEALEGCSKTVPSIKGEQNIEVPPSSKNSDEVIIKNLGVNLEGNERVILNVNYPENKEKLISVLKEVN